MKKFFKALAVVLALTLVIGTIPAAADVTIDATKVKKEKILYLGGTKGFKTEADGTKKMSRYGEKASYWRLLGITKEQAEELGVTATTSKEEVASVNDTTMKVKAQAMGTAKVTLKAGDASYDVDFTVKKSAEKVIFGDDFAGVTESKDLTINTEYVLSVPRFDNGVKMDTDQRTILITDKDGKDVTSTVATKKVDEKDPKKDTRTWTVKFTEGGDYTVKAWAYQSLKYFPGETAEKTITVTVKEPTPIEIKQTASDTFELTFDADIEKLGYYKDAHDWDDKGTDGAIANRVYYKVGGVVVPFSSVKSTTPKEDKLTVVMYGPFVGGTEYFVDIAGQTKSFVAAGNKAKDVTAIAITKKTALVGTAVAIEFELYNSAGIKITKTALADVNGSVSFSTDSSVAFVGSDNTIYFTNVGDKADVKGTFTFYDPDDNYKANEVTCTETIVGVAEDVTNYVSAEYSIGGGWYGAAKHQLPLSDDNTQIFIRATFRKGTDTFTTDLGQNIKYIDKELKVKVSDEHFAMFREKNINADPALEPVVRPVNEGATNFVLYYLTDDNKEVVLGTLPFTVVPRRTPTKLVATAVNEYTGLPFLNTTDAVADELDIRVTLYDQYGDRMDGNAIEFSERGTSVTDADFIGVVPAATTAEPWKAIWTIKPIDFNTKFATEKTVAFNVKSRGVSTVVSFKVKAAGDKLTAANIKDVLYASGNSLDTGLKKSSDGGVAKNVKISINKMSGNYFIGTQAFNITDMEVSNKKDASDYAAKGIKFYNADGTPNNNSTGSAYVAKITYNGSAVKINNTSDAVETFANAPSNRIYTDEGENFNDFVNSIYLNTALNVKAAGTPATEVQGFKVAGDTLIFDAFDTDNHNDTNQKLASGTYSVVFYKITDDTNDPVNKASKIDPLGSKGITVKDTPLRPTFEQLSQTIDCADTSTPDTLNASINEAYKWSWNGWRDVPGANVTYACKVNPDTVYVYYAVVTIAGVDVNANAMPLYHSDLDVHGTGYKIYVPVKELLKVNQ